MDEFHVFCSESKSLIIHFIRKTSQSYGKTRSGFVLPLIEEYDQDWKWMFLIEMNFLPFPPIKKPYINGCWCTIEPNFDILIVLGCRYTICRSSLQVWCKNKRQEENDKGFTQNTLFQLRRFSIPYFAYVVSHFKDEFHDFCSKSESWDNPFHEEDILKIWKNIVPLCCTSGASMIFFWRVCSCTNRPWARGQNFPIWSISGWQNLIMFLWKIHVCRGYFGMIAVPKW